MRDQPVAIKRNQFARVGMRFVDEPFEFGPAVISWLCGLPTPRTLPLFHSHMDSLMLCEDNRFQRTQYSLYLNSIQVYNHDTSI